MQKVHNKCGKWAHPKRDEPFRLAKISISDMKNNCVFYMESQMGRYLKRVVDRMNNKVILLGDRLFNKKTSKLNRNRQETKRLKMREKCKKDVDTVAIQSLRNQ